MWRGDILFLPKCEMAYVRRLVLQSVRDVVFHAMSVAPDDVAVVVHIRAVCDVQGLVVLRLAVLLSVGAV